MIITVNGEERHVDDTLTLQQIVDDAHPGADAARGVAVALHRRVVPRSQWSGTVLSDGDRVEIVTAVQGG